MADLALRHTPLTEAHLDLGARMAPFAGWDMPLEYGGTSIEHQAVRTECGVFDVSHLGTVEVRGPDAADLVAASFSNDPRALEDGQSQYTLCLAESGGILDDLLVYRRTADRWLVVPNASNTVSVVGVLASLAMDRDAEVDDQTDQHAIVAIQGPGSDDVAAAALGASIADLARNTFRVIEVDGHDVVVARTGYTGERGVELVCPAEVARPVWDRALDADATPCGLGARDTLRLEMGYPLHGHELGPDTTPWEARLGWAVKLDRPDVRAAEALRATREPARRLWGLQGSGRRPFRADQDVHVDGRPVGRVTSGGFSPTLEVGIALAYLDQPLEPGDAVEVDVRGRPVQAQVTRPPFVTTGA